MKKRLEEQLKKLAEGLDRLALNEDASTGMIAYFVICIFAGIFFYIGTGYIVDILISFYNNFISTTTLPISQDSTNTMNFMVMAFRAIPFLGLIMPLIVYGIFVSLRERNSEV